MVRAVTSQSSQQLANKLNSQTTHNTLNRLIDRFLMYVTDEGCNFEIEGTVNVYEIGKKYRWSEKMPPH